ncbi:uncharacterized protein LY79DRAFT_577271 [Colletotrichum navitas]|uniref:Uncharacterized protein n=1 Tax=Colletotrichum navitas TaxID=681940 RepID=A0AAD8V9P5_9PEZI|nr:uncharacterized protein LY79DRAFT_577271 [Colletotrichum navitas]KAK1596735.1 hypothetical protein LY79DRAFT_577271 [Colletotrichum navitas]
MDVGFVAPGVFQLSLDFLLRQLRIRDDQFIAQSQMLIQLLGLGYGALHVILGPKLGTCRKIMVQSAGVRENARDVFANIPGVCHTGKHSPVACDSVFEQRGRKYVNLA